jgi:hypothetical protein
MIGAVMISLLQNVSTQLEADLRLLVIRKFETHDTKKIVSERGHERMQWKDFLESLLSMSVLSLKGVGYANVE